MYHSVFNTEKFYMMLTMHYVFCTDLRTNHFYLIHH